MANDEELHKLLHNVTIASGGVLPKIHPELLARKKGGKFPNIAAAAQALSASMIPTPGPAKKHAIAMKAAPPPPKKIAAKKVAAVTAGKGKGKGKQPLVRSASKGAKVRRRHGYLY